MGQPAPEPQLSPPPHQPSQFDLSIHLPKAELEELGRNLHREIERYQQDTAHRRGNLAQWRRDFELYPTGRSTRWQHSADIASPFTHIYCQNHHTRLNQQIVQTNPPFAVIARKQSAIDAAPAIEEALVSVLDEANWQQVADDVHLELPVSGNCLLRTTYDEQYRRSPRFHYDFDDEAFQGQLAGGADAATAFLGSLAQNDEGELDVGLHWENVLTHAGVSFKVIPWEDAVLLPAAARAPDELRGIGERLMIRGTELQAGVKSGKYLEEAVNELLETAQDPEPLDRSERLTLQGIAPLGGLGSQETDALYRNYLCYELCWLMDANDDGEEEWVVVTLHEKSHRVLRLQYMPYEHGEPYYTLFRYFTRPRELLGMGIAEKLASLQDADTAVLNQIIDHADLILNARANFFYDQTSGLHPDKFVLKLGTPIPVDNVDGIKPFPIQEVPAEHYQVHQLFKDMADLVTASSNPSLGKATDTQKTLGEVQIVASASNQIFEEVASRVARTWAQVWDQVRWLYGQYGENGQVEYRVSAAPGHMITTEDQQQPLPAALVQGQLQPAPGGVAFGSIPASMLLADVDFIPAGLTQLSDMQSRLQQASIVQNTLLTHPLTMQNMPALKIGLDEFLQAARFRQREKIMAEIEQQQQAEMQMSLLMGQMPGQPPQGAPGPTPPAPQGQSGNRAQTAGGPQAPTPPPPINAGATTQTAPMTPAGVGQ